MPKSCSVPQCNSRSKNKKRSFFSVPKNEELKRKWEAAIPGKKDLIPSHFLCENHFEESSIIREYIHKDSNGKVIAQVFET